VNPQYYEAVWLLAEETHVYFSVWCTRCYQNVHRLGRKRNTGLTYSILAAISFKKVALRTYTVIPLFFLCFKSTVEVIFLNAVDCHLRFPLDVRHFQNVVPWVSFSIWETKWNHSVWWVGRMGNETMLLVTNSVVFRDVWAGVLLWSRSNVACVQIFC
jgi:hypothetical protein